MTCQSGTEASPTADSSSGPSRATYFDDDGDLRLIVGPDRAEFVVCSRAVARASHVWKKMLYGSFAEAKPKEGEWAVELPEDDAEAMIAFMNIIHCRFDGFPGRSDLTMKFLFQLAVIADKYDVTHLLRPWCSHWKSSLLQTAKKQFDLRFLWISWAFGHRELFSYMAFELVRLSTLDPDGKLRAPGGEPLEDDVYVQALQISEIIRQRREASLKKSLDLVEGHLSRLIQGVPTCCQADLKDAGDAEAAIRRDCDTYSLGSLIKALQSRQLFPLPTPEDCTLSAQHLHDSIRLTAGLVLYLEDRSPVSPVSPGKGGTNANSYDRSSTGSERPSGVHKGCNPISSVIASRYSVGPSPVTETHIKYLDRQAKRSGLDGGGAVESDPISLVTGSVTRLKKLGDLPRPKTAVTIKHQLSHLSGEADL